MEEVLRARTLSETRGFLKALVEMNSDRILGFTGLAVDAGEQLAAQVPARRPATADEIAEAIVFLATDRASFIYGAKHAVDGDRTAI